MPDVLKIAMERREALTKEISSLDKFIGMANELLAQATSKGTPEPSKSKTTLKPTPLPQPDQSAPAMADSNAESRSQTEAFLKAQMVDARGASAKVG